MDASQTETAQTCLNGAYEGSMAFPDILGRLNEAGVEGYVVDYRRSRTTYYGADGDSVELVNPAPPTDVGATFVTEDLQAAIRDAQAGAPGYTYKDFCRRVTTAGCAGYQVSILGRRVLYFGRTGETHTEHFPR